MTASESLRKVRTVWVERVAHALARGEGVRAGFTEQLGRFYDMLEQVVTTGDTAWLDPILYDWGRSSTETTLETGDYEVSFLMNQLVALTLVVLRENLSKEDALQALSAVMPILSHSLSVVIRHEMESRVAHIAAELGAARLKLEEVDRSKSNFISVAAHELKTPLTLIEGYASMMMDLSHESSDAAQMAGMLGGVETGIKRLRHIIDDMIDLSLIDNNLLDINFRPVWVSHLIKLLKNELQDPINTRGQKLVVSDFDGHRTMIYGDSERLFQALHNVASNAIKYTPDSGTITVNGRLLPGFVEITIADTGIGISLDQQPIVFDKFGQVGRADLHSSSRTKFKGGGAGLGLPIARGIVEAHGGSIWVESPGYDETNLPGSTFHILLPTHPQASDPQIAQLFDGSAAADVKKEASVKEDTPTHHPSA